MRREPKWDKENKVPQLCQSFADSPGSIFTKTDAEVKDELSSQHLHPVLATPMNL